jgi:hypothetical protein
MIGCSVLMGLAWLTKINAVFLFVFLGGWLIIAWRKDLKARWAYIASFGLIPPVMFIAFWPWLWPHPISRTIGYFAWMKNHLPIPVYYLGRTYTASAPWHYPFVLTLVTLPVVILLAIGVYALFARKRSVDGFLILSAVLPIALIALLSPCKNSSVRLFLPAFPFICVIAALGVHEFASSRAKALVFLCLLGLSAAFAVFEYGRYQECYYNEGVVLTRTGPWFETEYECVSCQELAPWLNAHAGSNVYRMSYPMTAEYNKADYVILISRQGEFNSIAWNYYLNRSPVYAIREGNGTPIVAIYPK